MFSKFPQRILFVDNFPGLSCDSPHFASRDTTFVPDHRYKNIFATNRLRRQRVSPSGAKIRFTYGPGRQERECVSLQETQQPCSPSRMKDLGTELLSCNQPAACTGVNWPPACHPVRTGAWRTVVKKEKKMLMPRLLVLP